MTACFIGHYMITKREYLALESRLKETIHSLILHNKVDSFIYGGNCGFDTMGGSFVVDFKEKYDRIRLISVLPCSIREVQSDVLSNPIYKKIMDNSDEISCISKRYSLHSAKRRNIRLVEMSDICVAYLSGEDSGLTAQAVSYAEERGLTLFNLA
ncbi:MAG: SLOG family protein [Defluviitaleaceae bacterium]|nr:SLOG family protein [Defluviitaleaceae bacterium]